MNLIFSCHAKNEVSRLFALLLGYNVTTVKVEINLSSLPHKQLESLLREADNLSIHHSQIKESHEEEYDLDDGDQQQDSVDYVTAPETTIADSSLLNLSVNYKRDPTQPTISKEITDPNLLFCMKRLIGEQKLIRLAKKCGLDILIDKRVLLTGVEQIVDDVLMYLTKIHFEKSSSISYNNAICLKATNFLKTLRIRYNVKVVLIYNNGANNYNLIVYGEDKEMIRDCRASLEKVIQNIFIILELPKCSSREDEYSNILEYYNNRYKVSCCPSEDDLNCQINMVENKNQENCIFFFFASCSSEEFDKVANYLQEDGKDLCLLEFFPNRGVKIPFKGMRFLNNKIETFQREDDSCLLIGKLKHLRIQLEYLLDQSNICENVDFYKIRIRNSEYLDVSSFNRYEEYLLTHSENSGFHEFKIDSYLQKVVEICEHAEQFISSEEKVVDLNKGFELERNTYDVQILSESTGLRGQSNKEDEESKVPSRVQKAQKVQHFPPENLNQCFFMLDSIKEAVFSDLDKNGIEFKRLTDLLIDYNQTVSVESIQKISVEFQWEEYIEKRNKFNQSQVQEYTVIFDSIDDPLRIVEERISNEELFKKLINSFDPFENACYKDADTGRYGILVCIVLFDAFKLEKILSYYPAYYIEFEFKL